MLLLRSQSWLLALLPGSGVVFPVGLMGLYLTWPQRQRLALLYLFFGTSAAALVLTFVTDRYRLPLVIVLLPWAAYVVDHIWTLVQQRRWRPVLSLSCGVLCLSLVSWMSPGISQQFPASEKGQEQRGVGGGSYYACPSIRGSATRYTARMRPLKKLTFEAFRDELATTFAQIEDPRDPARLTWEMPAVLMSAFAMFFFHHPSLLEYQRRMQHQTGQSNLERRLCPKLPVKREGVDGNHFYGR